MQRFAFIIHPIDVRRDVGRKYPVARYLPEKWVEAALPFKSPMPVARITGVRSEGTGEELEGWFIACPMTPRQLLGFPAERVYEKLVQCGKIAEDLGANIIGLGALTSVAGDGGVSVAKRLNIAVTTGNSYTVATAVEGAKRGAALMDTPINEATVAIVGAAGSIGRTSALLLGPDVARIVLIGRNPEKLESVASEVKARNSNVSITADVAEGLKNADVIVTVTSAVDAVILPEHLKRGAVICDVARPRDVSVRVSKERQDVLVIEGGMVAIPGEMRLPFCDRTGQEKPGGQFSFGFPPGTAYACMSETMMLALDNRHESFTLGKEVSVAQAEETQKLAQKHGFRLAGFRSFERAVTDEHIASVRRAAGKKPK